LSGEVQGSAVEFLSPEEVEEWSERMKDVENALRRVFV
jgi:hypothetical protein